MIVCDKWNVMTKGEDELLIAELSSIIRELSDRGISKSDIALSCFVATLSAEELEDIDLESIKKELDNLSKGDK